MGAAVDAAVELFGEKDYHQTSLKQSHSGWESVQSALHHHFGGKQQLLRAVPEKHYRPLAQRPDMEVVPEGRSKFVDEVLVATRRNADGRRRVQSFSVMTAKP